MSAQIDSSGPFAQRRRSRAVVVGAGVGGLAAAIRLAAAGVAVTVCERAAGPGGKMRTLAVGGAAVDSGPTVFTMRWAFDALFAAGGAALAERVPLKPADILARHAWAQGGRLDLFADAARSQAAVADFAGAAEARRFCAFRAEARTLYALLEAPFLKASKPNPLSLGVRIGKPGALAAMRPMETMWSALGRHFKDERLRQLFGRYATYCGASPFRAPATLMLVAHVEQDGVWLVEGGMGALARALADLAAENGAEIRYSAGVAEIMVGGGRAKGAVLESGARLDADFVVFNGDPGALAAGRLGAGLRNAASAPPRAARSQSAVVWSARATTAGFPLSRHTVLFSDDYAAEFDDVFDRRRTPANPTVYVCAQDRDDAGARTDGAAAGAPERLLILTNAPPDGDRTDFDGERGQSCEDATWAQLRRCGLTIERADGAMIRTTPTGFDALFPGTGGALYGRASHGWAATFQRAGARARIRGLYLAGGAVHPGPGIPMAALSGAQAAAAAMADHGSTPR